MRTPPTIIYPAAGYSTRLPNKIALPLGNGELVFDRAVRSMQRFFDNGRFMFIARTAPDKDFMEHRSKAIGVKSATVVIDNDPQGLWGSLAFGIRAAVGRGALAPLYIHMIDTFRCPNATLPDFTKHNAVFESVLPDERPKALQWLSLPSEPVSGTDVYVPWHTVATGPLRGTGLYAFHRLGDVMGAVNRVEQERSSFGIYGAMHKTAPRSDIMQTLAVFHALNGQGCKIGWRLVPRNTVTFCGTRPEYDAVYQKPANRPE